MRPIYTLACSNNTYYYNYINDHTLSLINYLHTLSLVKVRFEIYYNKNFELI